ncbi:hypothetical protein ACIQAC_23180 [Streptomyces sp. NPDC088387]|uniref:hypothetical protein n=1 Tax=Streptomyces sp. NPDC088387 TaxID=3365859 RepID=UPI003829CEC7
MTRIPGPAVALMLAASVVATTALAGCGEQGPAPAVKSPSASGSTPAPHPVVHLRADGNTLVPGGPPLPLHLSVTGLTAAQAERRHVALYVGTVPDELQIRENGSWHDVPFQWTNEQDDNGEFAAVVPLSYRGKARTELDFRLFTADQPVDDVDGKVPATTTTVAAEMSRDASYVRIHPAASATRLRLSVDPTHVTVEVPQILRATEGGTPAEWYVRVRNAGGKLTRSHLRVAISLTPGEIGQSVRQVHWSINREGRWADLTGQTHVETDEFELRPGESRTVRIRLALPADTTPSRSADVGAVLSAAVTAPWWPSDPDRPSGITHYAESTNILVER